MTKFAVTLASQMAAAIPATRRFIEDAVNGDPSLLTRGVSLATQMERLVYKPFQAAVDLGLMLKALVRGPFLIVIDGLDECEDKEEVKEFITHLLDFFKSSLIIPSPQSRKDPSPSAGFQAVSRLVFKPCELAMPFDTLKRLDSD